MTPFPTTSTSRPSTPRIEAPPPPPPARTAPTPTATPTPPRPATSDTFERGSSAREVRTPIVGQSVGGGGAASTLRGTLQDELASRVRGPATPPDPAFRSFVAQSGPDIAAVRAGLPTARDQMTAGNYAAAETTLHGLRTEHEMGFQLNGRLGSRGIEAAETLERQAGVCARMETTLHHRVSCPPSEADTRAYFHSFDSPSQRPQAQSEFRDYTRAFYTHTQQAFSPTSDIQYSPDARQLVHGGQLYPDGARNAPQDAVRVQTRTPDTWADVTSSRTTAGVDAGQSGEHAGRRAIDCEGYAYLSQTLMGEAGYDVQHVTVGLPNGRSDPSDLHSMTRVTDPSSHAQLTQSNGDFYSDNYTAYRSTAVRMGDFASPAYFTSPNMRDSQTLAMDPVR